MKTLLERTDTEADAAMAVQMFCYHVRKQIGALSAALGGLDLLVFTGGIGEGAARVRWEACSGLEHLGVRLDREQNDANADTIIEFRIIYLQRKQLCLLPEGHHQGGALAHPLERATRMDAQLGEAARAEVG